MGAEIESAILENAGLVSNAMMLGDGDAPKAGETGEDGNTDGPEANIGE